MTKDQSWLAEIGRCGDAPFDIAEAGLKIAALDRPGIIKERYRHHLKILAGAVARAGAGATTATARAKALRDVMWRQHGYTGDIETFNHPENANLMAVIDRRKGLPYARASPR